MAHTDEVEARVTALLDGLKGVAGDLYDLAAEHPESELLVESWRALDAADSMLKRYRRLLHDET